MRTVTTEERFAGIRNNLECVAEILATFEAAYEDNIYLERNHALNAIREAMGRTNLAYCDAAPGTNEVDSLGI